MTDNVELRHLRYFVVVAEDLSFTRAAERLRIAQPSLSLQIRQLESRIGTSLLRRRPRVALTPAGLVFLASARNVLRHVHQALVAAESVGSGTRGVIHVGFASSAALSPLPVIFRRFLSRYPAVDVRINEMHSADQAQALRDGLIDVGIGREAFNESPFLSCELQREPLVVVLPAGHPLIDSPRLRLQRLADEPFVLFPRPSAPRLHDHIHALCREVGFTPRIDTEAREWHTIVALVAAGLGVSIAPTSVDRLRIRGAVIRSFRQSSTNRTALFLCYSSDSRTRAVQEFATFVIREMTRSKGR